MQLTENQVSASSLADVFSSAFMDVSGLGPADFSVDGENLTIGVEVDSERKFLKFNSINRMNNIDLEAAAIISNRMNFEYVFASFAAVEHEGNIYYTSAYYMSYKKGIIKHQLVDNFKNFEKITLDAGRSELGQYF